MFLLFRICSTVFLLAYWYPVLSYVTRDIKCANILVDSNGLVKLADFGLAKEVFALSNIWCNQFVTRLHVALTLSNLACPRCQFWVRQDLARELFTGWPLRLVSQLCFGPFCTTHLPYAPIQKSVGALPFYVLSIFLCLIYYVHIVHLFILVRCCMDT
jgi:serine/threonine protein kinase